jgi:serine/threonine protein phosphatase PrpC
MYCGTTAIGAFLLGSRLVVFNIGDCQAVLCSGGVAVEMSEPHKPGVAKEAARVEAANGWVTEEKVGILAVS